MKKYVYILIVLIFTIAMVGCKKDKGDNNDIIEGLENNEDESTPTVTPTTTPIPTEAPLVEENHDGEMRSSLTGLWVPIEIGNKRPYAIQFNNFKTVRNQWGISEADIVYEALVEGGITRLLGIGENYKSDKIGSVRSSRHYFVSFADEYDSIYIHYGKTKYAVSKLKELAINNIDGETGIGTTVFYRDKSISAPNNAFTSASRILEGINIKKYETAHIEDFEPHFSFYDEDTELSLGTKCKKVSIKYPYNKPYLTYNAEDKLYYRYQFNEIHKDSNTGKQLSFKNIIVQFVNEWDIDRNDYQTMSLEDAEGTGFYISNGQAVPIKWEKNEKQKWMRYFDMTGQELKINQGKTYIAIYPDNQTKDVVIN